MTPIAEVFGPDGLLARHLAGYVPRAGQQRMAVRIELALRNRDWLLVEAGTGTGKTFAYLVPALLSGLKVLISTGTRTLQDQLHGRDLPLLAGALGRPVRIALLKGRSNYLCNLRLDQSQQQPELFPRESRGLMGRLRAWAAVTSSGDLAEVAELGESHPLRHEITATREQCQGARCPRFGGCHVFEARRRALEAEVVVVNHHLLMADMLLKEEGFGELLPSVDALVLDEAHLLPDLVAESFGVRLGSRQLESWLQDLRREHTDAAPGLPVEAALQEVTRHLARTERRIDWRELDWPLRQAIEALQPALRAAAAALASLETPGGSGLAARATQLAEVVAQLVDPGGVEGARALATSARGFALSLLPYDVSARFRALLEQHRAGWIFTSATLAVGRDFRHFAARLGLEAASTLQLESPFDFERQALLYLPPALPDPASAGYIEAVMQAVWPLLQAADGGAFLLFTSHRALQAAAQWLRAQQGMPWPLLVQGDAPREQLLRRFREHGSAVLLGAASFWEGVDVPGLALRLVVIDKLPFVAPDDPVVRARIEHLQASGGNPFRDYQLPTAVLALKQGVGRLIRSEEDRGVVMLCDPRLSSRGYGSVFLQSLPPMPATRERGAAVEFLDRL
ncbi:MAG TPA: ATP-dependent DNA helicase [Steroidobacteraceae bacterium]|nr:ATP-dependent DNA helicase [Steroidobacteraceae bacterium]